MKWRICFPYSTDIEVFWESDKVSGCWMHHFLGKGKGIGKVLGNLILDAG